MKSDGKRMYSSLRSLQHINIITAFNSSSEQLSIEQLQTVEIPTKYQALLVSY